MQIDKDQAAILLHSLEDAIRYSHMNNSPYYIRKFEELHFLIVCKLYRSQEMRQEHYLPRSILKGTDLGLFHTVSEIVDKKAPIVEKLLEEAKAATA